MALRFATGGAIALALVLAPSIARADDTIKQPGAHPKYSVEAEPHLIVGYDNLFFGGFGIGGRFSIPIMENGFIKTINNNVAIGFGIDIARFGGCYYRNSLCGETVLNFPVVMQWNFYVAERWSVFGEPGIQLRYRSFDACPAGTDCVNPSSTVFLPFVLYVGGRYHFSESVALTMRAGFDSTASGYFSVGVSFFP